MVTVADTVPEPEGKTHLSWRRILTEFEPVLVHSRQLADVVHLPMIDEEGMKSSTGILPLTFESLILKIMRVSDGDGSKRGDSQEQNRRE